MYISVVKYYVSAMENIVNHKEVSLSATTSANSLRDAHSNGEHQDRVTVKIKQIINEKNPATARVHLWNSGREIELPYRVNQRGELLTEVEVVSPQSPSAEFTPIHQNNIAVKIPFVENRDSLQVVKMNSSVTPDNLHATTISSLSPYIRKISTKRKDLPKGSLAPIISLLH